ncbi:LCP family protein [Clostridium isatidis]|uniref:LytR family transcriptional regulator n=1 Tax=Clostridium isatidis TaxID=182773 RepID=A0A343JEN1_9CLOT|nr:LCP family protein [Clostridium isatidis]ASW43989.1 LytR family transcriptional regulator [Clostridium isatidis]NLZ35639.1 LCP family protein [Clostridiales bacterium]
MDNNENLRRNDSSAIAERKKRRRLEAIKRKKQQKRRRIIFTIVSIISVIILGTIGYVYSFLNGLKTNTLGEAVEPASSTEPVNILLLGMDIGDVENEYNTSARRTDTIMLVNYNPNTKKVNVVSIPRDTLIEVDAYLDTGEYQRYWKINSAYAIGGQEEIIKHVESLLETRINYIVEVDYEAFRNIVDALGGVEMYIEQDMYYDDDAQDLHIHFNAGETVHLDGQKAEEFFRWRKNNDDTGLADGDIGRISNQHALMKKLVEKSLSPSIVLKIPEILNIISENVRTNMDSKTMTSLALKIIKLNSSDIVMNTLQGVNEDIYGQSFYVVYNDMNRELINAINSENEADSVLTSSIKREDIKILVLNGTQINGLAGNARDELISLGYVNVDIGNGNPTEESVIQLANNDYKNLISRDIKIDKFSKKTDEEYADYDIVILLGTDYNLFGEN